MSYRVLVTGSRDWDNTDLLYRALNEVKDSHRPIVVVHGACPTGADSMASTWCAMLNTVMPGHVEEEAYPAENFGPWPACGPKRNSHMVSLGADVCLAFFKRGAKNKGTQDCVSKAVKAGIKGYGHWSDGEVFSV